MKVLIEPNSCFEAVESPQRINWKQATDDQITSLHANDIWSLQELPEKN